MAGVRDIVEVLPPFAEALPGQYIVLAKNSTTCTLDNGADFDEQFLLTVGTSEAVVLPKEPITRLTFLRRLTPEQRIAIRTAAKTNVVLEDALALLDAAQDVRVDDPDTVAFVGYCVLLGLLTPADQTNILA